MRCPYCNAVDDRVIDSRENNHKSTVRRRRECRKCGQRYTTHERIEDIPLFVVKRDGREERYDGQKILAGLVQACKNRPVPLGELERLASGAKTLFRAKQTNAIHSSLIGEYLMQQLSKIDGVAFVRFASVHLDFREPRDFVEEIERRFGS